MTLRARIVEFLCQYSEFISLEDMNVMLNFINLHDLLENKVLLHSKYGEHFNDCPWSDDTCQAGPDTCECFLYHFKQHIVLKLIETYTRNLNIV